MHLPAVWQATGETAKMKKRSELGDRLGGGPSPHVKRVRREGSVAKAGMRERMAAKEREASKVVRLGDASMASAFTAKATSVEPCRDLIRQGRCTLVTMLQMYKILGVNCLCTAYILSVQNLQGVKQGDVQVREAVYGMMDETRGGDAHAFVCAV